MAEEQSAQWPFGNYAPTRRNVWALIASMKTMTERCWLRAIIRREVERGRPQTSREVPDDEAALRHVGIAKPEKVGANYQERCNILP